MTPRDGPWEERLTELHVTTRRMMASESVGDVADIVQTAADRLIDVDAGARFEVRNVDWVDADDSSEHRESTIPGSS